MKINPLPKTCWICGKLIQLEECKIDEHGQGVHENCYLTKLKLEKEVVRDRPEV